MKLNKNKLDLIRARKCAQLKDIAAAAGVSTATIQKGYKRDIAPECIGKIAKALNVDVEEIIVKEGE